MVQGSGKPHRWSSIAADEPGSVLLQRSPTGGRPGRSLLFLHPTEIIEAQRPEEVHSAFAAIEHRLAQGFTLAGYISYEAGFALEPALADLASTLPNDEPLLWFGCYRSPDAREEPLPCSAVQSATPAMSLRYSLAQAAYERQAETVRRFISAGETYQANLTMDVEWCTDDSPAQMYERLLCAQPVPYAALLHPRPAWHLLSLSPELFFRRKGNRIRTRPMKGTASPGMDAAENRAKAAWLRADEKNRAENVMIVDLLRNDLGRICETGSVEVTELFAVETYPTVLQMTSTVQGRLRAHVGYRELFGALFPSGSIVGAPKIHTMRLLHKLEKRPRRVYTGAIGYMAPGGKAEFSVAIRTVSLREHHARLGVGAGITFDSDPALEYAECLTKMMFLTREPERDFELIETLLLQTGSFLFLEQHLERMASSAEYFAFPFDSARIRRVLEAEAHAWVGEEHARVRLLLNRQGDATCRISQLDSAESRSVDLLVWQERTSASDRYLRHKTTHRALYDRAVRQGQAQGFADSLFCNTRDEVTEGAIHNVIALVAGEWITPPIASGVLPGVYRRHLLEQGRVSERTLHFGELLGAEAILICNSVRGIRRVMRLAKPGESRGETETLWTDKGRRGDESGLLPFALDPYSCS